jgi:dihydrodipicolinate synthase/N-acetylneuraminate lyase
MAIEREGPKGNWGTLLLPIKEDGSVDMNRLSDELDMLIAAGIDGIYSNGTACEFHNQTEAEFDRIQELLSGKCRSAAMPFQIGAGHPSPAISLERLKRCVHLRPDAFQVILPDWVVCGPEEQVDFLRVCADTADGIPLVLYNPPHAKSVLSPQRIHELASVLPSLIGVKVAGGDDAWYQAMQWSRGCFSVFVPGHLLAGGYLTGVADGAYSNVACLSPGGAQWWWHLIRSDISSALDVQSRILRFFDECIRPYKEAGYTNPALDKLLAAAGGWCNVGTRLRWPYKWIPESEVSQVSGRAHELLPDLLSHGGSLTTG